MLDASEPLSIKSLEKAYEAVEFDIDDGGACVGGTAYLDIHKEWECGINADVGYQQGWIVDVELIAVNLNGLILTRPQLCEGFNIEAWEEDEEARLLAELEQ